MPEKQKKRTAELDEKYGTTSHKTMHKAGETKSDGWAKNMPQKASNYWS